VPDKFEKSGLKAVKSELVDAPVIVGSKVVLECEVMARWSYNRNAECKKMII